MTDALPRSRGDKYAIAALKNKRAEIASEIIQLKAQLRARQDALTYVDATLKLLDPSLDVAAIPNKRVLPQRVHIFRQGELGRLILGVLRKAGRALSTPEIVAAALKEKGHGAEAARAMKQRVRPNLAYLQKRGLVVKSGSGKGAKWSLTSL